jgi:hypothetical protein
MTISIGRRELRGRLARSDLRRRWWSRPIEVCTCALHDVERDRIVILHGTDESLLREIAQTVGAH